MGDTESAANHCIISVHMGHSYSFQVQAHSAAGDSECSFPSKQIFVPPPPQSPASPGLFDAVPSVSPFKTTAPMSFSSIDAQHNKNKSEESSAPPEMDFNIRVGFNNADGLQYADGFQHADGLQHADRLQQADILQQADWPSTEDDPIASSSLMNDSFMPRKAARLWGPMDSFMNADASDDAVWPMATVETA